MRQGINIDKESYIINNESDIIIERMNLHVRLCEPMREWLVSKGGGLEFWGVGVELGAVGPTIVVVRAVGESSSYTVKHNVCNPLNHPSIHPSIDESHVIFIFISMSSENAIVYAALILKDDNVEISVCAISTTTLSCSFHLQHPFFI